MRKFIMDHLEVTKDEREYIAINFYTDSSGMQQNTFNVENMEIDLADLEILTSLLEDNASEAPNLTSEHVAVLDDMTMRLGLDKMRYQYFSRSRLND